MFYVYFRDLVERPAGKDGAGRHLIAITDARTPLDKLAVEQGFRQVFANPTEIGGRYSVLSYFGLVSAALIGLDLDRLIGRADRMREESAPAVPAHETPGVGWERSWVSLPREGGTS